MICSPQGRDCIEKSSTLKFNCSTTCEGIYTDIQWVEQDTKETREVGSFDEEVKGEFAEQFNKLNRRLVELENKVDLMKCDSGEKGEEVDKEKYKMLITEYKKFKKTNVQHFRFNSAAKMGGEF